MIEKPILGLSLCGGIFTYCTFVKIAGIFTAIGGYASGITAVIILYLTIRDKWRGKSK